MQILLIILWFQLPANEYKKAIWIKGFGFHNKANEVEELRKKYDKAVGP